MTCQAHTPGIVNRWAENEPLKDLIRIFLTKETPFNKTLYEEIWQRHCLFDNQRIPRKRSATYSHFDVARLKH